MTAVRRIIHDAEREEYRLSAFVLGIVASPIFQTNTAEASPEANGAP